MKTEKDPGTRLCTFEIGVVGPGSQPDAEKAQVRFYALASSNQDAALLVGRAIERLCTDQALLEKEAAGKGAKH